MTRLHVNGNTLLRAVQAATANLERHVDEVDALNVFPVPDGDTGSNMLATMRAALAEAEQIPRDDRDLQKVADALSRGALSGARGNSGVILSQIIRGMTDGTDGRRHANGLDLAQGLRKGSDVAYDSVLTPVEGTILTVIRDTADAAEAAAGRQPHVEAVLADAIAAAASSVQRTPTLLPVLDDAGVVDSGGQGLYRVLEGMLQVGHADDTIASTPRLDREGAGASGAAARISDLHTGHGQGDAQGEHGYETQYLLSSPDGDIDVDALRVAIEAVGDSVVVAGDHRLSRVHVHGERPDLAIAAGLPYGRMSQVEVLDLDDQVAHQAIAAGTTPAAAVPQVPAVAMVAATSAPGIAEILVSFGAHIVLPEQGTRPSVGEIAATIEASQASVALVLPNDRDAVLAARQAASLATGVDVRVVPSRNAAEGIAAAVAFDPDATATDNARQMEDEAMAARSFSVITAAKDSVVDGSAVTEGDIIAIDAARALLASGSDVADVALAALGTYDEFELVTVYTGASQLEAAGMRLAERVEAAFAEAEVEVVEGGQPHEHLLVAVE